MTDKSKAKPMNELLEAVQKAAEQDNRPPSDARDAPKPTGRGKIDSNEMRKRDLRSQARQVNRVPASRNRGG